MQYHFKIHKEGKGFWAECIELDGCYTQGRNMEELEENMQEALHTYLEEPKDSKYLAPLPQDIKKSKSIVGVDVDPSVALAFLIRYARIKNGLTQQRAAKELGMSSVYSYQRLEQPGNPTLDIIVRIVYLFPELSLDAIIR